MIFPREAHFKQFLSIVTSKQGVGIITRSNIIGRTYTQGLEIAFPIISYHMSPSPIRARSDVGEFGETKVCVFKNAYF
jgi:hypothetical protein